MNTITNRELEKGGLKTADLAAFADMPTAQQEVERDLNEPVLDHHNTRFQSRTHPPSASAHRSAQAGEEDVR
jgi:hypothetical protein